MLSDPEAIKFLYQGWSIIVEYDVVASARLRHYTWGIDKSGTIGGAGGVGGLLMIHQVGGTAGHYMAGYDGNGN
ncbi:MAG: hypothetical protein SFY80_09395, partial [Verrucomicrobiota bacterium]|nr:hypothetical protein [Verrucomicrobiota bacterium]